MWQKTTAARSPEAFDWCLYAIFFTIAVFIPLRKPFTMFETLKSKAVFPRRHPALLTVVTMVMMAGTSAMAAPLPVATGVAGPQYVVRKGDSKEAILRAMGLQGTRWQAVAEANGLVAMAAAPAAGTVLRTPLTQLHYRISPAHLTQTVGEVKVNGQTVHAGARVEENARISTGANSSAVLVLEDGSQIRLMPLTVAEITMNRYYQAPDSKAGGSVVNWFASKMRLAQGALEAAVTKVTPRAKPLEVETTTSLIGVRGTRFRVAAADATARQDRAEVLQGAVNNANTWKSTSIVLEMGQGAAVDPNRGEMEAVALLPALRLPEKTEVLLQPNAVWTFPPLEQAKAYRVIAASDAGFETVYLSEKLASNAVSLDGLAPGIWHLRVRGVDGRGLEGLDADTRVELRAPESLLLNPSLFMQPGGLVLRWSDVNFSQRRNVSTQPSTVTANLYEDAALTKQAGSVSSDTGKRQLQLPLVKLGTYYLRVSASNPALPQAEQQTYRFVVPSNIGSMSYHLLLERAQSS